MSVFLTRVRACVKQCAASSETLFIILRRRGLISTALATGFTSPSIRRVCFAAWCVTFFAYHRLPSSSGCSSIIPCNPVTWSLATEPWLMPVCVTRLGADVGLVRHHAQTNKVKPFVEATRFDAAPVESHQIERAMKNHAFSGYCVKFPVTQQVGDACSYLPASKP